MKKFICVGTHVQLNTPHGVLNGIVKKVSDASKVAIIETNKGMCFRRYEDLTVVSYKGVE